MEDLIPLLIVIAVSIIGAVTNKKKKNQQNPIRERVRPNEEHDNDFVGWLEKITNEDDLIETILPKRAPEPVVVQQAQNFEPIVETVASKNQYNSYSGFISPEETKDMVAKEGERAVKPRIIDKDDLTQQNFFKNNTNESKPKFQFEARKAVIYAEILKPKFER